MLDSRMEMTEDRISKLEDRSVEFTILTTEGNQTEKDVNRDSRICEMRTKDLLFIAS